MEENYGSEEKDQQESKKLTIYDVISFAQTELDFEIVEVQKDADSQVIITLDNLMLLINKYMETRAELSIYKMTSKEALVECIEENFANGSTVYDYLKGVPRVFYCYGLNLMSYVAADAFSNYVGFIDPINKGKKKPSLMTKFSNKMLPVLMELYAELADEE